MTTDKELIYSTRFYEVYPNDTMDGYFIFNKITKVKEGTSTSLTSIISQCEAQNSVLTEIVEERRKAQ